MSVEANKAVVRRFFEEYNAGTVLANWDELVHAGAVLHDQPGGDMSSAENKAFVAELRTAFPDHHVTIDDLIAEGDKVVIRFTESGTMKGDLMGMKATGKRYTLPAIEIYRLADGKIIEMWSVRDMGSLMQQLGVVPPPA